MDVRYGLSKKRRSDGRYQGFAYIPGQKKKYVYDRDRQACKQKLSNLVDELQAGVVDSNTTVKHYAEHFAATYCIPLSPTTIHSYLGFINNVIIPSIGDKKVKDITTSDIQDVVNEFSKIRAEKTAKNLLGCTHKIFSCAVLDRIIKYNPCDGVKTKRSTPYEYYIYNVDEMKKLLECVGTDRNAVPIVLAALCGLRSSEIMALRWSDIDFENNTLSVNKSCVSVGKTIYEKVTKTKSSVRTLQMPAYVSYILSIHKRTPDEYVYGRSGGRPENVKYWSKRFKNILIKNSLPITRFHDLRHFNATTMMIGGIPDKQTAAQLGHADTNITKKYQHILKSIEDRPAKLFDTITTDLDVKIDVKQKKKA